VNRMKAPKVPRPMDRYATRMESWSSGGRVFVGMGLVASTSLLVSSCGGCIFVFSQLIMMLIMLVTVENNMFARGISYWRHHRAKT